jgi:biofilm PGA synthesis protein PgaA
MRQTHTKIFLALSVAFLAQAMPAHAAPTAYTQAVKNARAGRYETSVPVLEKLVRDNPAKLAYRYDLIAVLSWANRHTEAANASENLRLSRAVPPYVLAAIGKSTLESGQPLRSSDAYRLLAQRRPQDPDVALSLALALLSQHEDAQADVQLARALKLSGKKAAPLQNAAAALKARGEPVRATPFLERLQALGLTPTQPTVAASIPAASATTPVAAAASPSASLASTAQANATAQAVRALGARQEQNGVQIRKAEAVLEVDYTPERYRLIDAALSDNADLITQARAMGQADILRRLRFDRVVALKDRREAAAALSEFNALEAEGETVPPYVISAAADATMQLRQPEQARALYQRALSSDPANIGLQTGLMYSHLEAENFPDAEHIVGDLLTQTNQAIGIRRTDATLMRFSDRLKEADVAIERLHAELPGDAGIWLAQADLMAQRGLPRAAAKRYGDVLAVAPDNIAARVGLANAVWAQGDIIEAGKQVNQLQADAPEHTAVQRLYAAWKRRERPYLTSTVTKGFGQGSVSGNDDLVWESTIYSGQTDNGIRLFGNHHLSKATFDGNSASHERAGMGIEWTRRDLQANFEVGHDLRNGRDNSWAAGVGWQLNDEASLRARHESETNDFPLKGRLPNAEAGAPTYLHATKTLVGGAYRWNESRRVAADLSYYDFNDGNQRKALSAVWFERLYSGYGKTLDLQTAAYTSANSNQDAIYFNPKHDVALSATLAGDWQTWRRYERSFNQRLAVTLGTYRQTSNVRQDGVWGEETYGWNPFTEVRYEHEWQFGPDRSTRYGIGSRHFPYDGKYETKTYVYLNVNWRF